MTVSVASFKARFREFAKTDADAVQAALDGVEATTTDSYPSTAFRDEVVLWSLAEALALSPAGRDAQAMAKGTSGETATLYSIRLAQLKAGEACLSPNRWGTVPDIGEVLP